MDSKSIVESLRRVDEFTEVRSVFAEAADRIEELEQEVDEWVRVFDMLNDRENRHHYLEYWREKNGRSDLCFPDGDQIYKDFWELKNILDRTGHWVWDENGNDWGIGAWMCSECGCKNDNLGTHNDMNNWFMKRTPYMFAGSKYCPQCGVRMVEPNE